MLNMVSTATLNFRWVIGFGCAYNHRAATSIVQ
jgi:hypothetical protein